MKRLHREHPTWEVDLIDWEFCHFAKGGEMEEVAVVEGQDR
ncbi:MAG: hypothetical protein ACE5MB_09045 [Anaerolineae bacterium]